MTLELSDLEDLRQAKALLENPGIAAKLTNLIGTPIEKGFALLPSNWQDKVALITRQALMAALKGALLTMKNNSTKSYSIWHKAGATLSGAAGGFFGMPALAVELPISTTIMLRSIADIGRANGENLASLEARLACLEVFALGGTSPNDDASESAYFAVRGALAKAVTEAVQYLAEKTIAEEGAPALVRLIATVAARFQVQVSEKAAAQAVPIIGAAGGAAVNYLFIDHFQDMSRGHFTVRRLERKYGCDVIQKAYMAL